MTPSIVRIVAHRGHSAAAPENSLAAMDRAIAAGADLVECDVRMAGDGVLVVSHDADLARLTGRSLEVSATAAEELARVAASAGASVLRLTSFLRAAHGRIPLMLDVKSLETTVIDAIARASADTGFDPSVLTMGLRGNDLVAHSRATLPDARILALHGSISPLDGFLDQGVDLVRLWEHEAGSAKISALKQRACTVWVTTGGPGTGREVGDSDQESLIRVLANGADGLVVNDPDLGRRAIEAMAG